MLKDRYSHISDQDLLEKFRSCHDNYWLGILLQRYTLLMLGVCMKYLKNEEAAKDAVQQIFLKALTELPKYQVDYLKSWLYTIARNYCLMQLRDKTRIISVTDDLNLTEIPVLKTEALEKEQTIAVMEACLEKLNPPQRTCVRLFYLHKKSYQEIAEDTGYHLLQVKSHIQNGKRNLKILVSQKLNQEHV